MTSLHSHTGGISLDAVDQDGALQETAAAVAADTRAGFLTKAGLLGGGAFAGAALFAAAPAQGQSRSDIAILNFALTLEYLEAAFYAEAIEMGALEGETEVFARVAGAHERVHVRALRQVLGRRAVRRPRFNFRGTTEDQELFTRTAIALEEVGVGAYKGQAPLIRNDDILAAALSIHSVEARHAAWIRDIAGVNPAPRGLDRPLTRAQTLRRVAATRFIVAARPRTRGRGRPRFTG